MDYDRLLDFCNTPKQQELIKAIDACHGNVTGAARLLGLEGATTNYQRTFRQVQEKAAKAGYAPGHFNDGVAPGYAMGKVTVHRGKDGEIKNTWERQSPSEEAREAAFLAAIEGLRDDLPREPLIPRPAPADDKLLNMFTLTDSHVGMMAWHEEGGDNWDLKIAEDTLCEAFRQMITRSPPAKTAIVNQLGDFLHFDGIEAVTPTSKHIVDVDGRFAKISRVAVRILRRVINMALETHESVHVICAEGNHDIDASNWMTIALEIAYENNPRCKIETTPLPFYSYRHGKTLLGFHHGHTKKTESLPLLFAQLFRSDWGASEHTYIHTGHRHHVSEKDSQGVFLVQHATLAARDAYAARFGYLAARRAAAITYHADYGEWGRAIVTPDMLVDEKMLEAA